MVLMNLATRREFCLFHVSGLVHSNSTVSPWWVKPGTVVAVGPPTAAGVEGAAIVVGCACIGEGAGAAPKGSIMGELIGRTGGAAGEAPNTALFPIGAADVVCVGCEKMSNPPTAGTIGAGTGAAGAEKISESKSTSF